MGRRPNRLDIGFQKSGEKPRIRIWIDVKYEARVNDMLREREKSSKAGMTDAAVKVVIIA